MIPVLYDGGAIDPRRLGKGKLSDIISCVVHEELNGDFSLTFQYPITGVHYDEMTIGSSIIVNMPCFNASNYHSLVPVSSESGTKRDIQVFDIYKKSTPIDGVVTFYCQSIVWRLKDIVYYKSTWNDNASGLKALMTNSVPVTLDSTEITLNNVQFEAVLPYVYGQTTTYSNSAPKSALSMFLGDSESVVSSMGVLFADGLLSLGALSAASMLVFSLLYTPCVAAIASIRRELGGKWALAVVLGQCGIAWLAAMAVRLIGMLFGAA